MNTSEKRFENGLRRLTAADTTNRLRSAIAAELNLAAPPPENSRRLFHSVRLAWSVAGVSLCLAVALLLSAAFGARMPVSEPEVQRADVLNEGESDDLRMVPVDSRGVLLVTLDEGIVYLETGQPVRKLRFQYVDTVRLRDTAATAAIEITTPREEVRFLPVDSL